MHDPLKHLDKIAARARGEQPPRVDVSERVVTHLLQRQPRVDRPLLVFALGSVAAAIVVALITIPLLNSVSDPLWALFQPTHVLMP
ncbi:hypothetical protein ACFL6M_03890 [Candidatus Eisenbacteria bacterium]|uniref:Uncharacterized protein n=1 Tax=Eiseniibacteriota bacterium TaxID=2212470 RepID=A0ABV6YK64_UNCEI